MISALTYIILKAIYDTYRIKKSWGKKENIKHWIIDVFGFSLMFGWFMFLDRAFMQAAISFVLFIVIYSLLFSPILNLFRVVFLKPTLGRNWDVRTNYKWGDVTSDTGVCVGNDRGPYQEMNLWNRSKALAILCYRSNKWYDAWTYKVFPGSDIRLRWSLEISLLIILIVVKYTL